MEASLADMSMVNSKNAVCTIVSKNYLAYAKVLAESALRWNTDISFHLLIVDRKDEEVEIPGVNIIWVEELGIPEFEKIAFKYNILELNTNVKPTLLLKLLEVHEKAIYLDPDILVCSPLDEIYAELQNAGVVLTPHVLTLNAADAPDNEINFLNSGAFNLGFVGVSRAPQGISFLKWWEERCLHAAYDELENGLFVDQKWINLIHCGFDSVKVLRHFGMNVAYWNYHERQLTIQDGAVYINGEFPLVFFHFSGLTGNNEVLSKYKPGLRIKETDVVHGMLVQYKAALAEKGHAALSKLPYSFGKFSNGNAIQSFTRRIYAATGDQFSSDPFDAHGDFYHFAQNKKLIGKAAGATAAIDSKNYKDKKEFKILVALFKVAFTVLGVNRYDMLMKFLRKSTTVRKQAWLFDK